MNIISNKTDTAYHHLLNLVMQQPLRGDRTGTGTRSLFGHQMRFSNVAEHFPLISKKRVHWKSVVAEILWMLKGSTNIKPLVDQGVNIWNDWPLKHYNQCNPQRQMTMAEFTQAIKDDHFLNDMNRPFSLIWGELGPVYGKQWRKWYAGIDFDAGPQDIHVPAYETREWAYSPHAMREHHMKLEAGYKNIGNGPPAIGAHRFIDQILDVQLQLRNNPESRRMIVQGWNPGEIEAMKVSGLPPCHMMMQFYTREIGFTDKYRLLGIDPDNMNPDGSDYHLEGAKMRYLDCQVYIRSNDLFLGAPFNIAGYGLLMSLMAKTVGMIPGDLVYTIGDAHIYSNHFDQVEMLLARSSAGPEPKLAVYANYEDPADFKPADIVLEGYVAHDTIKAPVAV